MIPKRAVGSLLTTVVALALLFGFKTPEAPSLTESTSPDTAVVGQPSATIPARTATPTGAPTRTTTPTSAPPSTATASAYVDGTAAGPVVSTRFGDVQVQVTISGGVVSDVTALQLPSGDGNSRRISKVVEPILRDEALTAQTAQIDLVSGATYTSRAYETSLQAALDKAAA